MKEKNAIYHLQHTKPKISKSLGIILRLAHFVPTDTLLSIYPSLIQPYITYQVLLYGAKLLNFKPRQITYLAKTCSSFNHCLIHFAPYRSHAILLFIHYNILPLNFQYCKSVCTILIHDVSNNSSPVNIS